ncbi:MAG: LssY C-terminal domain-containing protein [Candidatus Pacebacteria bacterium]|nr:LssY C-terminal domain-containing protein [Candidatus Paceibacterota bacterium]
MHNLINNFLPIFEYLGSWGYLIILVISFLESIAFIGAIIPGTTIIVISGFLASQGYWNVGLLIIFAAIGSIFGDSISYYFGTKGTKFFKHENKFLKLAHLEQGKKFFALHGDKSILLARFAGVTRAVIPFVAGLTRMDRKTFIKWIILSALLWAPGSVLLGYFFGGTLGSVGIEKWLTRASVVVIVVCFFVFLIWLMVKKSKPLFLFIGSIFSSVVDAILTDPEVQLFIKKHPSFFGFLKKRFLKDQLSGRPLTFFAVTFAYVSFLFFGVIQNVLLSDPVVSSDIRIENLLVIFRAPELTSFFLWITVLGKWQVVGIFCAIASLLLLVWGKRAYIIPMYITLAGSCFAGFITKIIFHRPRPEVAIYVEQSFSFPSVHAITAVAFYGFITYILYRNRHGWKQKTNILFWGILIIFGIGFSRLYLGVHFLSDVWGGYLLGFLWLIIGVGIAEWLIAKERTKKELPFVPVGHIKLLSVALLFSGIFFYATFSYLYRPIPIILKEAPKEIVVESVDSAFQSYQLPRYTETLVGNKQEPLNVILVAGSDQELINAMQKAGWFLAEEPNIVSMAILAKRVFYNENYTTAPMTPSFWNAKTHDFGFEKPTEAMTVRERHHARFWKTDFQTKDGASIYVGTASLDIGIKSLIAHKIDPAIDVEREFLFSDLQKNNLVLSFKKEQSVKSAMGTNFAGDTFFTDGNFYIISLKQPK